MRRVIFGGTFNPVHHGHLIVARHCAHQLDVDSVWLVPNDSPPHRPAPKASFDVRHDMIQQATVDDPLLTASDIEKQLSNPSYTVDTIEFLNNQYESYSHELLVGADELVNFQQWHRWEDILTQQTVHGMTRPGFSTDTIPNKVAGAVNFIDVPRIEIQSTEIRRMVSSDRDPHYLIPNTVLDLIKRHHLYAT